MDKAFLRGLIRILAKCFGWLTTTLPSDYHPVAQAFLRSLVLTKPDIEYPVPEEILPTIALAVLNSIFGGQLPPELDYSAAVEELNTYSKPILVQWHHYPVYKGKKLEGYMFHPHYYVMGGFTAFPQGGGAWLIQDKYDWHQPDTWRVPNVVARHIPGWILKRFAHCTYGVWLIEEVGTLDRLTVPYWHRSIVKLADYLNPQDFE